MNLFWRFTDTLSWSTTARWSWENKTWDNWKDEKDWRVAWGVKAFGGQGGYCCFLDSRIWLWCIVEPLLPSHHHGVVLIQGPVNHHSVTCWSLEKQSSRCGFTQNDWRFFRHLCCLIFASDLQDSCRKTNCQRSQWEHNRLVFAWLYFRCISQFWGLATGLKFSFLPCFYNGIFTFPLLLQTQ
jgi:hypothetical protein